MNLRSFAAGALLVAASALSAGAAPAEPAAPPPEKPVLALVVVTALAQSSEDTPSAYTDFDRLDLAFQDVAKRRHWPVTIVAERFAANTPAHALELRVFLQPIRQDLSGEFSFRGWMTLNTGGRKHDFGIILYRLDLRPGEPMDDFLEKIFHGAAALAARKIEPVLFPDLANPKP
ncbi:MAG TPA: hypothetical protein VHE13_04030 [Opitutus sp.]|nr:hypothetical protein [Opitutus sp.]